VVDCGSSGVTDAAVSFVQCFWGTVIHLNAVTPIKTIDFMQCQES